MSRGAEEPKQSFASFKSPVGFPVNVMMMQEG